MLSWNKVLKQKSEIKSQSLYPILFQSSHISSVNLII